jgi:hypothetical protein
MGCPPRSSSSRWLAASHRCDTRGRCESPEGLGRWGPVAYPVPGRSRWESCQPNNQLGNATQAAFHIGGQLEPMLGVAVLLDAGLEPRTDVLPVLASLNNGGKMNSGLVQQIPIVIGFQNWEAAEPVGMPADDGAEKYNSSISSRASLQGKSGCPVWRNVLPGIDLPRRIFRLAAGRMDELAKQPLRTPLDRSSHDTSVLVC